MPIINTKQYFTYYLFKPIKRLWKWGIYLAKWALGEKLAWKYRGFRKRWPWCHQVTSGHCSEVQHCKKRFRNNNVSS